jgi:eukaryotic-like serine/threonine-protein kinase
MPLSPGAKLGPYQIEALLGAGGMGEVYRARDTRLGRDVALKILPETFAQDADRLLRFEQESLAVAALNHPNILAIYDVGHHSNAPFLVTELLEGESLRVVLDRGALPHRKVIDYGVQITHGLAAAHDKGIVHRDLKPENLFLTRDGRVKILDFGLAKLASPKTVEPDGATMARSNTAAGVVMGTASYMAPEQVQGKAVDARTDIFALGAVLFEMLSGRRAFQRDTTVETMTAVLKDDPPDFLPRQPIAPALDRIVRRCLEKNPEERFQSARDLSFALGVLSGTETSGATHAARAASGVRRKWFYASVFSLLLLLVVAAGWLLPRRAPAVNRMEFAIPLAAEVSHLALSPDGRILAFVSPDEKTGASMLFVQLVGTPTATELPGTEGVSYPFWSPDDQFLAFFANGRLQKIPATGGPPQVLARVTFARGGSWGKKNVILYSPDAGGAIWRVNPDGSNAAPLTDKLFEKEDNSQRWPFFLPDGDHFLYLSANFNSGSEKHESYIYLTSLEAKQKKLVVNAHSNPSYAEGQLFWVDDKKVLRAAALNMESGSISGSSTIVVDTVGYQPSVYWGAFSVAQNGTVVYSKAAAAALSVLTWHDRSGKELGHVGEIGVQANPALSPDGSRVAIDITDLKANNLDIWINELKRGTSTRFTFDPAEETDGVWSHDGTRIAYRTVATGAGIQIKEANGMASPRNLVSLARGDARLDPIFGKGVFDMVPNSWSRDDKVLLCSIQYIAAASTLALIAASGGDPVPFLRSQSSQTNGQISPDGKWVAYASNESGDWEVYVTTFPDAAGKWQVSRGGGGEPRWRGDGKEIFYLSPAGTLMAVATDAAETFSSGTPTPLFQVRGRAPISSTDLFTYDVTKDGQRFLVNQYVKPEQIAPLTIVQHALADTPK